MEVKLKGTVARRRRVKKRTSYVGLRVKLVQRIEEKPGENYRDLSSYLEAQPNSVRATLSREIRRETIVMDTKGRYFRDYLARSTYSLEHASKLPESHNAPEPDIIAATAKYWVPVGCVLGAFLGYGLSQL